MEAVTHNRKFDEDLDPPRFREAFTTLAATRTSWPAPPDFIGALPERKQLALTKQSIPADPERAARAIAEIAEALRA